MSKWISVKDDTPQCLVPVLVRGMGTGHVTIVATYDFESGGFVKDTSVSECYGGFPLEPLDDFLATHWMHLPEPPK